MENIKENHILCPACNTQLAAGTAFCTNCGAKLTPQSQKQGTPPPFHEPEPSAEPLPHEEAKKVCPVCKAVVKGDYRFCTLCGADLEKTVRENASHKEQTTPPKRPTDYSSTYAQPARYCPSCKLGLPAGTTVCPRCGKVTAPAKPVQKPQPIFRTLSIIAYCAAGFAFFIGLINLLTVFLSQFNIMGNTNTIGLLSAITSCLFMAVTSLCFTVLGSCFLSVYKNKTASRQQVQNIYFADK